MTNQEKINKLEKKGYKVTSNIGYKNDIQTIVSYTLKDKAGKIINQATSITKLLK